MKNLKGINPSITRAAFALFDKADNDTMALQEQALALGLDRESARPLCVEWAGKKYGAKPYMGQRGLTLPQGSAAIQAVTRVMQVLFPDVFADKRKAAAKDPVAALVKAYNKLDGAQKRSFRAKVGI